jgi:hypothetical protein
LAEAFTPDTFVLGADAQTDWVLARPLSTLAAELGR